MAFTGNFQATQLTSLSLLQIVDTSSGGTDSNITFRHIYLYRIDGTTLVPAGTTTDYINFPISAGAGDVITLDVLAKDYSLSIFCVWNSTSPITGATYVKTVSFTAVGNTNLAAYGILQSVSANPALLNTTDYAANFSKLYLEIDNANQAQVYGDNFSAQGALDRAFYLVSNQSKFF